MDLTTAKLRVKAKKFRDSIPINMAIPLPDNLVDSLLDEDVPKFFEILKSLGLQQRQDHGACGYWERI